MSLLPTLSTTLPSTLVVWIVTELFLKVGVLWRCEDCTKCTTCGRMGLSGEGPNACWMGDYTMCYPCGQLAMNHCSLCKSVVGNTDCVFCSNCLVSPLPLPPCTALTPLLSCSCLSMLPALPSPQRLSPGNICALCAKSK